MTSFCRLCAETKHFETHVNLNLDQEKFEEVRTKVKSLNLVCDLAHHDYFPTTVCPECLGSLSIACNFLNKVSEAQKVISNLLSRSTRAKTIFNANKMFNVSVCVEDLEDIKPVSVTDIEESFKHDGLVPKLEKLEDWSDYFWKCYHCNKMCKSISQLRKHSIQEHGTCCAFSCADCTEYCNNSFKEFVKHVRTHRTYLRNYCKYCNTFQTEKDSVSHEMWHELTFNICMDCGETFDDNECLSVLKLHKSCKPKDTEISLKKRNTRCNSENSLSSISLEEDLVIGVNIPSRDIEICSWNEYPWICRLCKVNFDSIQSLRSHVKIKHNKCAALQCLDCDRWFGDKPFDCFIKHVGKHRKCLSVLCYYCDEMEPTVKKLRHHVKKEHLNIPYCKKCGELFKSEQEQQKHAQNYYVPKQIKRQDMTIEDRTCKACNKVFRDRHVLKVHVERIHLGKTNFTCDQCGSTFYFKTELQLHQSTAHENHRFNCKLCDKSFIHKLSLRKHVRFHSTERPFTCDVCGMSFKLKSLLKNHKTIHSDEKPFECQHCNKSFRLKLYLKRHEITHTGLKPYSCKICNVSYADRQNCYNHMKKKHNIQRTTSSIEVEFDEDDKKWKDSVLAPTRPGKKSKKEVP